MQILADIFINMQIFIAACILTLGEKKIKQNINKNVLECIKPYFIMAVTYCYLERGNGKVLKFYMITLLSDF